MRKIYMLSPVPFEGTEHLPMITFRRTADRIDFGDVDTLLFTSKKAVAFADTIDSEWKRYDCFAVGAATAEEIKKRGGRVVYLPETFYGEKLASDIVEKFAHRRFLYLRPETVSFDAKSFLQNAGISVREAIIYKTECVRYDTTQAPQKGAVIVFTSPSTIHCFLRNFAWDESYTAVVIGEATKVHLPSNARFEVAEIPRISACVKKAREILRNSNAK
jgi:uroporphyrinogen-III synthase